MFPPLVFPMSDEFRCLMGVPMCSGVFLNVCSRFWCFPRWYPSMSMKGVPKCSGVFLNMLPKCSNVAAVCLRCLRCLLCCHRATVKMYVSMSVSVQCLSSDVECDDVPAIWCLRLWVIVQLCCLQWLFKVVLSSWSWVMSTKTAKSRAVSKDCQSYL